MKITTKDIVTNLIALTKRLDVIEPIVADHTDALQVLNSNDVVLHDRIVVLEEPKVIAPTGDPNLDAIITYINEKGAEVGALGGLVMKLEARLDELALKVEG